MSLVGDYGPISDDEEEVQPLVADTTQKRPREEPESVPAPSPKKPKQETTGICEWPPLISFSQGM